jgi:hypothetical protein
LWPSQKTSTLHTNKLVLLAIITLSFTVRWRSIPTRLKKTRENAEHKAKIVNGPNNVLKKFKLRIFYNHFKVTE